MLPLKESRILMGRYGRIYQNDKSHFIMLLLPSVSNSMQKIKITHKLLMTLSLKNPPI